MAFPKPKNLHIGRYTKIDKDVWIGDNVWIGSWVHIRPDTTLAAKVHIRNWCMIEGGGLYIGHNTRIMQYCNITAGAHIGRECFISPHVVMANDRDMVYPNPEPGDRTPPMIRDKVRIGVNATILPGVVLGEGCVIGAGAVVTKDTEPYTIYVGNPARPIRKV
jgi:acetyltransferase-like isoleucine patch superfamily enzyme